MVILQENGLLRSLISGGSYLYKYYLGDLLLCTSEYKIKFSIHFPHIKEEYVEKKTEKVIVEKTIKKEKKDV